MANTSQEALTARFPFGRTDNEYRGWEIGYWIRKDLWGRGLATAAVKAFTAWTFAAFPDVLRLEGRVLSGNEASMSVLERAGYTREGTRRQAVFKHDKVMDSTIFGILRSECEGVAATE
jgi:[ribosomal protein S5]-alanine N-acetyltransferase